MTPDDKMLDMIAYGLGIAMREVEKATWLTREQREQLRVEMQKRLMELNSPMTAPR